MWWVPDGGGGGAGGATAYSAFRGGGGGYATYGDGCDNPRVPSSVGLSLSRGSLDTPDDWRRGGGGVPMRSLGTPWRGSHADMY